jgi:hypothetical protein
MSTHDHAPITQRSEMLTHADTLARRVTILRD